MRLTVGRLLLPLLLLCFSCLAAENGKSDPSDHDGTKETRSLVETVKKNPNVYLERSGDDPTAISPLAEFPCPVASVIEPCICLNNTDGTSLYLDCTFVESEEQLAAVFQQEFPVKEFYEFRMSNNSAVKMLDNIMNGITFESLFLSPGPFDLDTISDNFLLDLKDTLNEIWIEDSKLISEMFPFLILPLMTQLSTLHFIGSDMNGIPPIRASNLSYFEVSRSPVERLVNGTISVGTGGMTIILNSNNISTIELGSIFFADEESAASNERLFIDLSRNKLQSLQAGMFLLRNGNFVLQIYNNQIVSIEPGTFVLPTASGDGSYGVIHMEIAYNQIQSLQTGTFPLRNAEVALYFYSNSISSIEPGTFVLPEATDSLKLQIDLGGNALTTIDEVVFGDLMPFIAYLGLYENPLTCGCDLAWLILNTDYMGVVDGGSRCADGTLLQDLNPQDFVDLCLV